MCTALPISSHCISSIDGNLLTEVDTTLELLPQLKSELQINLCT